MVLGPNSAIAKPSYTSVSDAALKSEIKKMLRIPRRYFREKYLFCLLIFYRPYWDSETSASQLQKSEKEAFLNWRRTLSLFQEEKNVLMTPFERNIEMWRQLWRVLEKSQLVVQIVDARNPLLFFCEDVCTYSKEIDSSKKHILLINKADFLTDTQRTEWANYFKSQNMEYVFYSAVAAMEVVDDIPENKPFLGDISIFGKDDLIELFEKYARDYSDKFFTVGLVGYPNVGKSSTINSLFSSKKVAVAMTPGKTKHYQTLFLTPEICLCDCPGLVFPNFSSSKADLIVNGILPIDQMREYITPCQLVATLVPRNILEHFYGIYLPLSEISAEHGCTLEDTPPSASQLLSAHAVARGFHTSFHGIPDESRSARFILKDFVSVIRQLSLLSSFLIYIRVQFCISIHPLLIKAPTLSLMQITNILVHASNLQIFYLVLLKRIKK